MLRTPRTLSVLAAALVLAACSSQTPPASSQAPSASSQTPSAQPSPAVPLAGQSSCGDLVADGKPVHFGSEIKSDLYGRIFGTGRTGIVISHMNGGDVCQGTPYAKELAQAGYRTMVFDFGGFGVSKSAGASHRQQVVSAAAALRADGATRIVLLGGSMGATASLAAAPDVTPPPAAVVALSPPLIFLDDNASAAAAKLTMPVFYAAGGIEPQYPANVKQLDALTPKGVPHVMMLADGSTSHGLWLVDPADGVQPVRAAILDFLKKYAPAT
jgi:dienelactone hydrolase